MPRKITFEGATYTFPDDATDDEVASMLDGGAAPAASGAPAGAAAPAAPSIASRAGSALSGAVSTVEDYLGMGPRKAPQAVQASSDLDAMMRGQPTAAAEPPKPPPTLGEQGGDLVRGALRTVDQGVRGVADGAVGLAGIPVDLMAGILNRDPDIQRLKSALGVKGDIQKPFLGSDFNKAALDTANDATVDAVNTVLPKRQDGTPLLAHPEREAQSGIGRFAHRVGEEVGSSAIPVGFGVGAAKALGEGVKELPALARLFAEPAQLNRAGFVAREAGNAAVAGAGAGAANEITRAAGVDDHSGTHMAGDLAGALGALGTVAVGREVLGKGAEVFNAVRGSENFRNQVTNDAAVAQLATEYGLDPVEVAGRKVFDTQPIVDAIERGRRVSDTVPGFRESLADRTGSPNLAALEYARESAGSTTLRANTESNVKAVDRAVQAQAPTGSPGAFRSELESRRTNLQQDAATTSQDAQSRFEEAAQRLQSSMHADARGADIRAPLEDALAAARVVEGGAWDGVAQGSANIRPLVDSFAQVRGGLSEAERQVFEPSHLTGIPQRFLSAEAAEAGAEAAAAGPSRAGLNGLSGDERAMGENLFRDRPATPEPAAPATPAAPAMSREDRIMDAIERSPKRTDGIGHKIWDVRDTLGDMPEHEFRDGLMKLQADRRVGMSQYSDPKSWRGKEGIDMHNRDDARHIVVAGDRMGREGYSSWPNGRPHTQAQEAQLPQRQPEPPASAAPAAPEAPEAVDVPIREAVGLRGTLTDAQRAAASAGETKKAQVIGRYVDAIDGYFVEHHPNLEAFEQARSTSRDLNDRFTRPQTDVAQVLDRNQGQYRVPDSGVPGRFVRPDSGNQGGLDALMREAGHDPRARNALQDQIRADVQGLRGPDQVDAYVREHSRIFERFPELRQQVEEASGLRRTADAAVGRERDLERSLGTAQTPGSSSVGRYLRYGDEASETAMRGVMNAPKPAEAMGELLDFAGNRPEAVEGARRTFWDILEKHSRRAGETTATIDGGAQPWMPKKLLRFLDDPRNEAVAQRLYRDDPEQLGRVRAIAETLQNVDLRASGKARNASGTPQGMMGGLTGVLSPEAITSRYYAMKSGRVGPLFFATSILSVVARKSVAKAQSGAIAKLVDEALVNPDLAAKLLRENNPANRAVFERATRSYLGGEATEALKGFNEDTGVTPEDPVKAALAQGRR